MEDQDNYGLVFYREKLYSPTGYSRTKKIVVKKEPITLKEGNLFTMCLKYVSLNTPLLDSLVGFPEIVGKQLFNYMVKENVFEFENIPFNDPSTADLEKLKTLTLFNDAYNELVLSSLSFSSMKKDLDSLQYLLACFDAITELDLSHIKLNDAVLGMFSRFHR